MTRQPLAVQELEIMDDDQIRAAIARARGLSEQQPEPFRSLAFRTVLETLLLGGSAGPAVAAAPRSAPSLAGIDLVEFLAAKKAETHPDRAVAIAYYNYRTRNGAGVSTRDLVEAYGRARIKKPQNFPDVIAACVRRGHLVEGGRKEGMKSWVITRTGESHVEGNL